MSAEKTSAIILRLVEFSESSSVVTMWTREFGKVGALAKGARRQKGPFDSALDLLTRCRVVFLRKSSGGLDLLTEAKLEHRFRPKDGDLNCLYAGYYLAELLLSLTDDYDPHPELFDVTARTLVSLTDGEPLAATVLRFELATLRLLGHLPNLEQCVECAEPIEAVKRIAFSQLAGGTICSRCRPGKRHVVSISAPVLMTLRQFADETSELWRDYPMEKGTSGELRGIMNHTISHLLGQPPRMQNYLGFLASS